MSQTKNTKMAFTFDVQLDWIGEGGPLGVGSYAVIVSRSIAPQALQHQALVTHNDASSEILSKVHSLMKRGK